MSAWKQFLKKCEVPYSERQILSVMKDPDLEPLPERRRVATGGPTITMRL